ncbi:hypothetical protein P154DRAFT_579814 [Amniculicola lignicola CBS 123094]|uniref:Uncharacterized protein n=1 Tax=Amniculicola lignicola CBS 123094 TaxID=1392246 RepID=A0A6A5W3W9_9PLEO|nr:hypothetical protein P154DRAFT_579814 [Amniculicola lignicola CBS 123094]
MSPTTAAAASTLSPQQCASPNNPLSSITPRSAFAVLSHVLSFPHADDMLRPDRPGSARRSIQLRRQWTQIRHVMSVHGCPRQIRHARRHAIQLYRCRMQVHCVWTKPATTPRLPHSTRLLPQAKKVRIDRPFPRNQMRDVNDNLCRLAMRLKRAFPWTAWPSTKGTTVLTSTP